MPDRTSRQINDLDSRLSQEGSCRPRQRSEVGEHLGNKWRSSCHLTLFPMLTDKQCKNAFCQTGPRARATDSGGLYLEVARRVQALVLEVPLRREGEAPLRGLSPGSASRRPGPLVTMRETTPVGRRPGAHAAGGPSQFPVRRQRQLRVTAREFRATKRSAGAITTPSAGWSASRRTSSLAGQASALPDRRTDAAADAAARRGTWHARTASLAAGSLRAGVSIRRCHRTL